ncbi:hypothetical protein D9758_008814 [Tetrapyrgos nigripes]|uniref:Uncharacterized protein n=1 Tax=Tetrapyrgos nigripes TaxID=182062 RepID=A0A8H5D3S1_9AGAR|nr:hypothetical protein D9758_008814 [Tetrapyrgos nigripes]
MPVSTSSFPTPTPVPSPPQPETSSAPPQNPLNSSSNLLCSALSSSTDILRSKAFTLSSEVKESNSLPVKITPFSLVTGIIGHIPTWPRTSTTIFGKEQTPKHSVP